MGRENMAKKDQQDETSEGLDSTSKVRKTFLFILAAFLTFAGPTYMVYVFVNGLDLDYAVSMASGFALFLVGLALMLYLVRSKAIS